MSRRFIVHFLLLAFTFVVPANQLTRHSNAFAASSDARRPSPAPSEVLGFNPGDDRKLASWASIVEYFKRLSATSDRVRFEEIGKTTMGRPFVYATITAPENLKHLEEFKAIQRQLADPRLLGKDADSRAADLIKRGKTIVLITCGVHSTEVGSTLSSTLIAHRLATSNDPEILDILRNTIVLLVPSLNPDGVDIVKSWYDKTLGTPFEGSDPPELYHKYTGHDNNRDWYAFTQVETQLTVDKIHNVWHPQIVHDIHQQGIYGSRLFLPPYMKPVEPNVPAQIVDGFTQLGNFMAAEMRAAGFKGITTDSTYDAWTPARAYSHYHGGVRILSETASAKLATPTTVKFSELRNGQGYNSQKESTNFAPVWPGGEWHLRGITNNMTTAAFALLKHASKNREQWLSRFYQIGKEAVRPRVQGEVAGFAIEANEKSSFLLRALVRGGVELQQGYVEGEKSGSPQRKLVIVRLDQPYGAFAKALLENQHYPDLRSDKGEPVAPYDVTAHSLALLSGVNYKALESLPRLSPLDPKLLVANPNTVPQQSGKRVALYKSSVPVMDEGWTRWILDSRQGLVNPGDGKGFGYSSIRDADIRAGKLKESFDVLVIPDQSPRSISGGYKADAMPAEFASGLGAEGIKTIRDFVEAGGTLVALNRASDFAIQEFKLPVRDVTDGLKQNEFYAPGSILRTELDTSNPLAAGMPKESIAWVEDSPVFELTNDSNTQRARVIASYPQDKEPLISGWLLGGERIRGKAAMVEVPLGKGRIILFGFRPQYRAQSLATYPLFFNALK